MNLVMFFPIANVYKYNEYLIRGRVQFQLICFQNGFYLIVFNGLVKTNSIKDKFLRICTEKGKEEP